VRNDLGVDSDNLLFGTEGEVLLEFKVTDSPRQCEVSWESEHFVRNRRATLTVDSAEFYESTSSRYSSSLL
jgi:hypothetical protein